MGLPAASLVERREIAGLDRSTAHLSINFDVDAEALWLVMAKGKNRPSLISQGLYGLNHGVPRALDVLRDTKVKATFFIPGLVAHNHPTLVQEIASEGHEIASHCYTHMPLSALEPQTEWDDLRRTKDLLEQQLGKAIEGFAAPVCDVSERTIEFLIRLGFSYDRSFLDSDWPYLFRSPEGALVELPISWVLDDFTFFGHNLMPTMGWGIAEPSHAGNIWRGELQSFVDGGGFGCLVLHPEVVGRRTRISVLRDVLAQLSSTARFATCAEIAKAVRP
ncbi:MAG: polysaccharide deacetylase family protein [Pseudorhodoplanes sp.]